ncbi:MAG: TetR/AcrR family transcriptional regulator [Pseudomonadota bacterium]
MVQAKRPEPRKLPRQERSRALYDALLTASAELLERDGPTFALSDVAARAGVSPGSLYQYFPDRPALVAALIDRQVALDRQNLEAWTLRTTGCPVSDLPEELVAGVLGLYGARPALLSNLVRLLEETGRSGDVHAIVVQFCATLAERLHQARPEADPSACGDAAEAAVFGVLSIVRQAAQSSPEKLSTAAFRARLLAIARTALDSTVP